MSSQETLEALREVQQQNEDNGEQPNEDYQEEYTNRERSPFGQYEKFVRIGLVFGLVISVVWISFLGHELVTVNQAFRAPAGKNPNGFLNCYYSKSTGTFGPGLNSNNAVNVTAEFALCLRFGVAVFLIFSGFIIFFLFDPRLLVHKFAMTFG